METTQLRLLPALHTEGPHHRAQRLLAEAKSAADDQVSALQRALLTVAELALDVGHGSEVYPVGVRDLSAKIAGDASWCGQTLQAIMKNNGRALPLVDPTETEATWVGE